MFTPMHRRERNCPDLRKKARFSRIEGTPACARRLDFCPENESLNFDNISHSLASDTSTTEVTTKLSRVTLKST